MLEVGDRVQGQGNKFGRRKPCTAGRPYADRVDPNDKELAIFMLAPAMVSILANLGHRSLVRDVIRYWVEDDKVRAAIAGMTLEEIA